MAASRRLTGAITILGPDGDASASLYDIAFEFTEIRTRDGAIELWLEAFSAANEIFPTTSEGQRLSDWIYPHPTFDEESAKRDEAAKARARPLLRDSSGFAYRGYGCEGGEP